MSHFAICRTKKITSFGGAGGAGSHIDRTRDTPNADPELTPKNRCLVGERKPLAGIVRGHIGDAKLTKNAPIAFEVMLTGSPEQMGVIQQAGRFEDWVRDNVAWLRREYGDNLVRAELHMDESTPHIHAIVVPVVERFDRRAGAYTGEVSESGYKVREGAMVRRVNAGHYLNGRQKLSELQDRYAMAMDGFGLIRGQKRSLARHTTIKSFYQAIRQPALEMPKAPKLTVPEPKLIESKRAYGLRAANKVLSDLRPVLKGHFDIANQAQNQVAEAELERKRAVLRADRAEAKYHKFSSLEELDPALLRKAIDIAKQLERQQAEARRLEQEVQDLFDEPALRPRPVVIQDEQPSGGLTPKL